MQTWQKLQRSERATIGRFECDVWRFGDHARYTVLDTLSGFYVRGGRCASLEWAKEVSAGFARSLEQITDPEATIPA